LRLRWGFGPPLPVHGPDDPEGFADLYRYPGPLDFSRPFSAFERRLLGLGLHVTAIPLTHSRITFGYLIESATRRLAYLTDTVGLPPKSEACLKPHRLDLLALDCTFPPQTAAPRNHNDITRALQTVATLSPDRTLFTSLGHALDAWFAASLARNSRPESPARRTD
jgi:phosphoribosyl 1,2-cyclic phosphate phosphodiesterase